MSWGRADDGTPDGSCMGDVQTLLMLNTHAHVRMSV